MEVPRERRVQAIFIVRKLLQFPGKEEISKSRNGFTSLGKGCMRGADFGGSQSGR